MLLLLDDLFITECGGQFVCNEKCATPQLSRTLGNAWLLAKQYHSRLSECPYHIEYFVLEVRIPCEAETKREQDDFTSASQLEKIYIGNMHHFA